MVVTLGSLFVVGRYLQDVKSRCEVEQCDREVVIGLDDTSHEVIVGDIVVTPFNCQVDHLVSWFLAHD